MRLPLLYYQVTQLLTHLVTLLSSFFFLLHSLPVTSLSLLFIYCRSSYSLFRLFPPFYHFFQSFSSYFHFSSSLLFFFSYLYRLYISEHSFLLPFVLTLSSPLYSILYFLLTQFSHFLNLHSRTTLDPLPTS